MFDRVRCGFVRGKLDVVNSLVVESVFAGDVSHEFTDLVEELELCRELDRLHPIKPKPPQPVAEGGFSFVAFISFSNLKGAPLLRNARQPEGDRQTF